MALQSTMDFQDVVVLLSDGVAVTPTFAAPCGFDTLTMTRSAETNTSTKYDCDDATALGVQVTNTTAVSQTLSGSGTVTKTALPSSANVGDSKTWMNAVGKKFDMQIVQYDDALENPTPTAIGYWSVNGLIENFSQTGTRGELQTFDVNIILNDQLDDSNWTDGAP